MKPLYEIKMSGDLNTNYESTSAAWVSAPAHWWWL